MHSRWMASGKVSSASELQNCDHDLQAEWQLLLGAL